ncbi:Reverse transcriptase (RNA-dependent DNA polymerase) [Novymonas esmeraldas]|uniref:Reverse transcriptase (RNA-dependent DNA polymerase) n=1 Tax=Novymonas esmeraldas TaxID=1808958 RepID=A0AAW0EUK5_9TRYP
MGELEMARRGIHRGSAPGPDNIYNESLRALPPRGRKAPLAIRSQSIWCVEEKGNRRPSPRAEETSAPAHATPPRHPHQKSTQATEERMAARCIRDRFESLPQPQQTGFRPLRPPVDPLDLVLREVVQRPYGTKVGAVPVDNAMAFDSVDHGCSHECAAEVPRGPAHPSRWIMDFLSNRTARFYLSEATSKFATVTHAASHGALSSALPSSSPWTWTPSVWS